MHQGYSRHLQDPEFNSQQTQKNLNNGNDL